MLDSDQQSKDSFIRDIDAMARAASMWVRQRAYEQRFIGAPVSSVEEIALAAGFLAGLKSRLELGDGESALVAYAYALMMGQPQTAARTAERLVEKDSGSFASCAGYMEGLKAARQISAAGAGSSFRGFIC
ncbi:MAG: hypothetical protein ACR2QG_07610 [Gammaproteobacteria bacterium]